MAQAAADDGLVRLGRALAEAASQAAPGVVVRVGRARASGEAASSTLLDLRLGAADVAAERPISEDTLFRIFSLTKVVVSIAVLPLLDAGALALTDPVSKWLPEFGELRVWQGNDLPTAAAANALCVRDLLCHTAGMFYPDRPHNGTPGVGDAALTKIFDASGVREASSLAEACVRLAKVPLVCEPGTRFSYSVATLVVGRLLEVISGEPLEHYLSRALLAPLGMESMGFFLRNEAQRDRLANLYTAADAGGAFEELSAARKIFSYERGAGRGPNPDGGLFATLDDCARFAEFLVSDGRGLCSAETLQLALSDQLAPSGLAPMPESFLGFESGFGLATYVLDRGPGRRRLCGWSGLAGTHMCFEPETGRYILLMTQCFPFSWRWQARMVAEWP